MIAFAGNSLLCRLALKNTTIDAATFTSLRMISGALVLWLLVQSRRRAEGSGSWLSAAALFTYAAAFSFAYLDLTAATGALLLFGSVQATMISRGLWIGERLTPVQWLGFVTAVGGLVALLLPGLSAPPLFGSALMIAAGLAWGEYTLRGKGKGDPTVVTAGNFMRTVPMAVVLSVVAYGQFSIDAAGAVYAIMSGALASGVGYAIWYAALPALNVTVAATTQLSVPVIATLGGAVLLDEPVSMRLVLTSLAILGGIALVILNKRKS